MYRNISVAAGCRLALAHGVYDVRELVLEPEATLVIAGQVGLNVGERFSFADRASVMIYGNTSDFTVYTNQTSPVYVGVASDFHGYLEAPHADVNVAPFAGYTGCIHANGVHIEADAAVLGDNLRPVVIKLESECLIDADCDFAETCEAGQCEGAVSQAGVVAVISITSDWAAGYCTEITVQNNKTAAISSWQVVIDVNDSHIDNYWNGAFAPNGNEYTVSSMSWNGAIQPGGTQSFGFCASKTGANYYPEVISASGE
jgi:hypothetical protein